ncbi:ammonium transporter [Fructilactobacillus cliffordii]|uniref:Ammonium transporter n=1 Tax=Fructilactobacillus cliffordii TaxID=2940299 RepID=A0A9Q9E1Y0_9LACO|nr:ammonium transporter [Fructilactobacillus cliffordii]USS86134.1 ammonium transporter [Fructilactobacillus cliffordii]USS89210.1 ammonium transporter [Fructilactobacillus cliffordii]
MAVNVLFIFLCSILVFVMTPGLAFFYGGMVPRRDINNTLMAVFIMCCVPVLLWVICGYSLSFSGNNWNIIGNLHNFFLHNLKLNAPAPTTGGSITNISFLVFQMMFALITPALFVGAVVERINFRFLILFVVLWSLFVYYPLVHIVWGGGFLQSLGVLDFAGGLVVHINAGVTALLLAYFLGPRLIKEKGSPKSLSWVLLGTTFLWIGWYGFNAGSAFAINGIAMQAMLTTTVATATAMLVWVILDVFMKRNATLFGICSGAICGLVAITPACGFVSIESAMIIGAIATMASYGFITVIKPKLKVDDTLDAFGCHGVSGIVGSILTGLFATKAINPAVTHNGWLVGGSFHQFGIQLGATLFTVAFTMVVVTVIIMVLKQVMSMRMRHEEEIVKREMADLQ